MKTDFLRQPPWGVVSVEKGRKWARWELGCWTCHPSGATRSPWHWLTWH